MHKCSLSLSKNKIDKNPIIALESNLKVYLVQTPTSTNPLFQVS